MSAKKELDTQTPHDKNLQEHFLFQETRWVLLLNLKNGKTSVCGKKLLKGRKI